MRSMIRFFATMTLRIGTNRASAEEAPCIQSRMCYLSAHAWTYMSSGFPRSSARVFQIRYAMLAVLVLEQGNFEETRSM